MRRVKKLPMYALALFAASVATASSPEQPVDAKLEPQAHGKKGLKLTVSRRLALGYDVEVRRQERGRGGRPEFVSVGKGLVSNQRSLIVEETPAPGPDGIVRARYEILVKSDADRFHGALVVSQAFVEGPDGALVPIDFTEVMRRGSGKPPMPLAEGDLPAGAPSSEPVE